MTLLHLSVPDPIKMLIFGAQRKRVCGNHPNINESALDDEQNTVYSQDATPFRSTDLRDVYGTVLKHWINMDHNGITSIIPLDTLAPASEYWTMENFDLDLFDP